MSDATDDGIERFLRAHGAFEKNPSLPAGSKIGGWKTLAFLGRGGSAEVYRAENAATGLAGAVKILYRSDEKTRTRFMREARLLAEVNCVAFPKFYGAGEDAGRLYIAEELLEPSDIPRGDAATARYVLDVAHAVEELHRRGLVHRDIKPTNVMVRPATGRHVLIDFGLLKESGDAPSSRNDTLSVQDGRAVGVGTPGFSAPEQFVGGRIGAAADIHALGVLANVCFDGKPPQAWIRIIRRSTSSIPEQRYATVAEFARAVRRRHAVRWWIGGIAAGLAIGVSVICMTPTRKDAAEPPAIASPPEMPQVESARLQADNPQPVAEVERPPREDVQPVVETEQQSRKDVHTVAETKRQHLENAHPVAGNDKLTKERIGEAKQVDPDDKLLGAVYDSFYGRDNGRRDAITNKSVAADSTFDFEKMKLGETKFEKGVFITHIELDGRDVTIPGEIRIEGKRRVEIVGPGRITASITGSRESSVELSKQATLINLTKTPYPESKIKFVLKGLCYLNFKNLDPPADGDIKNV